MSDLDAKLDRITAWAEVHNQRARQAELKLERLHADYVRLQEAVISETTSLPMVRSRILEACE